MTYHSNLSDKIEIALQKKGMSKVELAKALGVTKQRINGMMRTDDMRWSTILKVCDAIGIDVAKFVKL
jgi:DNA-binding Xre family transcriptional regulator